MPGANVHSIISYNFHLDTVLAGGGGYADNEHDFVNSMDGAFNDGIIFQSQSIMFFNHSGSDIFFSFDGVNDHGRVPSLLSITQDYRRVKKIWLRGGAGLAYQFWAW